ncbi:MAG TPA: immunoglobulin domain-containing protein [Verrucomicrobiae bacterium]
MNKSNDFQVSVLRSLFAMVAIVFAHGTAVAQQPVITVQPANQMVANGGTAIFSVAATGAGPFTYWWLLNGANLPAGLASGRISTVAGNGVQSYSGDGGAATNASLNWPGGVLVDATGNLLIADQYNNCIRRVDTNGTITTIAGTGTAGFSGDGGPATNACVIPTDLALDAAGNLYFAEAYNARIRRVDTSGIITTVAGNGVATYAGDGGAATNASLNFPCGVAFDANGNLFIGDQFNNRVRRVDTNGIITTVAGNGDSASYGDGGAATNAGVRGPVGLAFDRSGNLYIAQYSENRVRRMDTNGIITTVAGGGVGGGVDGLGDGGPATNAILSGPQFLACTANGSLLIADFAHNVVRQVDTNGIITVLVGTGAADFSGDGGDPLQATLNGPVGLALDPFGDLFISDYFNQRVREVLSSQGPTLTIFGAGLANAGNYQVVITGSSGSVTSSIARLTVVSPPVIATQPVSRTALVGATATFTVTATGTMPLKYQWNVNGVNISGATNATLVLPRVQRGNAGSYRVTVSNPYGSTNSTVATLTVMSPSSSDPAPAGLVGWWPAEGTARDVISGSNGTVYSGTTFVAGEVGQCFSFDGANGCVMNTNTPPFTNIENSFTMEFWVWPKKGIALFPQGGGYGTSGESYAIFPDWGGVGNVKVGAGVSVGTNGICVIEHGDGYMPSMLTYTNRLSGWVHVAVVYANKQPMLFLNGEKVKAGNTSGIAVVYPSKNLGGTYGSVWKDYGPFKGLLDEVSIYNRALSANEIAGIYHAGRAGKRLLTTPTIAVQPASLAVVQSPQLQMAKARSGAGLQLNWPLSAGACQVQWAENLSGPWTTMMAPLETNGANISVTVTPTKQRQFFRLQAQ